jgi:hypothetical protein
MLTAKAIVAHAISASFWRENMRIKAQIASKIGACHQTYLDIPQVSELIGSRVHIRLKSARGLMLSSPLSKNRVQAINAIVPVRA